MDGLRQTPLHPQWLALRSEKTLAAFVARNLDRPILDIGCGGMKIKHQLKLSKEEYIGLDYPATAEGWYRTRPDIFADGQRLPIKPETINSVLLLNVLEHIPDPAACLTEIHRVLKAGGVCIIEVPFLYPLHDEPLDFHRWTRHGLSQLCQRHGFEIVSLTPLGQPTETVGLFVNIALSKSTLTLLEKKNPLALMMIVLVIVVPFINLFARLLAMMTSDNFMPFGYRLLIRKKRQPNAS